MKLRLSLPIILLLVSIIGLGVTFIYIPYKIKDQFRRNQLEKSFNKPLYLNLEDSSRSVTFSEIGITYDKSTDKITINNSKLNSYLESLEKEYEFLAKNTIISFEDFTFRTPSETAQIKIDRTPFESKETLAELVASPQMKIKVEIETEDNYEIQKSNLENLADKISNPLLIKYGRNPIYIPKDVISGFISMEEIPNGYQGVIEYEPISAYLHEIGKTYASDNVVIVHNQAVDAIRRALLFRAADYQVNNAVILPLEGKPKTNGELHDVYLEVIKSQQRLYRFENGHLVKTYVISTGLTWETPAGQYKILGKEKMAISYTNNWYMPDYLPIGFIQGAYKFGFHAIPYHMDGNGNIYSRDPNTMGSPATGGCIQLSSADALELFNWAWVGIPVYVYE